jgi:hypothetical protein
VSDDPMRIVFDAPDRRRAQEREEGMRRSQEAGERLRGLLPILPGIQAQHAIITDECRASRGDVQAFSEAIARVWPEYLESVKAFPVGSGAKYHLVLSVEPAPAAPQEDDRG